MSQASSVVLLFDREQSRVTHTEMPPGPLAGAHRTADGDLVWYDQEWYDDFRAQNDASANPADAADVRVVFGSIVMPDHALCFLTRATVTDMDVVSSLRRPSQAEVMEHLVHAQMRAAHFESALSDTNEALRKARSTHATYKSNKKREVDGLKTTVADMSNKLQKVDEDKAEAEAQFESDKAKLHSRIDELSTAGGSSSKALTHVGELYVQIMERAAADLQRALPKPPAASKPSKKKAAAAAAAAATLPSADSVEFYWRDDSGRWLINTDPGYVDAFREVYSHWATAQSCTDGFKVDFTMMNNGYDYEAFVLDPSGGTTLPHMQSGDVVEMVQHNTQTGRKRNVVARPSSGASSHGPSSDTTSAYAKRLRQSQIGALCGPTFPSALAPKEAEVYTGIYDFEAAPQTRGFECEDAFAQALSTLANLFAQCSQTSFAFEPSGCEPLVKPFQMRNVLHLVATKGVTHFRLVAHASSDYSFDKIRGDGIGLDLTYCRTTCRYGKANYVANTYDAGELQRFNSTGVPGKTMLLLLFSPHARHDTSEPAAFQSYNFAATLKIGSRQVDDAYAVFGNSYLLPLGIVTPK